MELKTIKAGIKSQAVNAYTFPEGPRGRGIREVIQRKNSLEFIFDDDSRQLVFLPNWWFGTRTEYNHLSESEKNEKDLYFIEEGT